MINQLLTKYWWVALVFLSIPASWALGVPGFFGASDDLHIAWLYEMDKLLQIGQIPPRFVPDLSFGFGYPLFNFVFPLPFYLGEAFHLLGLSFVDSVKMVFFFSLLASAFSMYFLTRNFASRIVSLAVSAIYIYTPYRSTDIYVRGAIGEALTFVFLPLITLSIFKISSSKIDYKWIATGALSLAALILTHNITTLMFLPFLMLLMLLLITSIKDLRANLISFGIMILGGFGISSYFWVPALVDSGLMKYDTVFNFVDHFPTIKQLIIPFWGYGASVAGPYDGMSFFIGFLNLLFISLAILILLRFFKKLENRLKIILTWIILCFLLSLVMMNYRSSFLWQNLPLLPYFQFPWRFLIITTFVTSLSAVIIEKFKFKNVVSLVVISLVLFINTSFFKPHDFLGRQDDYYLNRYIPTPYASEEYKKTQEEYLRLPKDTLVRPNQNYPIAYGENLKIVNVSQLNPLSFKINTTSDRQAILNLSKYFFPGWEIKLNGLLTPHFAGSPFGQISLEIPKGEHEVTASFKETNFKLTLDIISLLLTVISILAFLPAKFFKTCQPFLNLGKYKE